jgi:hypothetical protein
MPFHQYDHAKEFGEIINRLLRESKIPGIVDVYKLGEKCIFFYRYSTGSIKLNAMSNSNSMEGSMECYTSDDILDQIEDIIYDSYGLMILP